MRSSSGRRVDGRAESFGSTDALLSPSTFTVVGVALVGWPVAAAELGFSHQLCVAHVRKYVTKRSKSILEQANKEWGSDSEELAELEADLGRTKELLDGLGEEGGRELGWLHRRYLRARPPDPGGSAGAGYRMRMLTLEAWNKWGKLGLHLKEPELGLDGTNNASSTRRSRPIVDASASELRGSLQPRLKLSAKILKAPSIAGRADT